MASLGFQPWEVSLSTSCGESAHGPVSSDLRAQGLHPSPVGRLGPSESWGTRARSWDGTFTGGHRVSLLWATPTTTLKGPLPFVPQQALDGELKPQGHLRAETWPCSRALALSC